MKPIANPCVMRRAENCLESCGGVWGTSQQEKKLSCKAFFQILDSLDPHELDRRAEVFDFFLESLAQRDLGRRTGSGG